MIIDAFIFNDEIDILELRLGQLDSIVDYFVFVETNRTFTGMSKPLYYLENKDKFSKWHHKIIHASPEFGNKGAWEYEILPREALVDMVRSLNPLPEDTLTFSDCDEIPNPDVVRDYTPDMGLRNLKQFTFWYNFNHMMNYGRREWSRARIGRVQDMYELGAMAFRGGLRDLDHTFPSIENGGWHGSYFGNVERIKRKVESISHDDLVPFIRSRTDKQIADDVINGRHLYHCAGIGDAQWWDTNDPRLPSYFLENKDRFKMFTNEHFVSKYKHLLQG